MAHRLGERADLGDDRHSLGLLDPRRVPVQLTLILKRANKNRLVAIDWGSNDFDVCEGDCCIGRIFLSARTPQGRPWFGQSLPANIRRQPTVAATHRDASKR
jgi:hypothetical protein